MSDYTLRQKFGGAHRISDETLRQISRALEKMTAQPVEMRVSFQGDHSISVGSIDDLKADPLVTGEIIESINLGSTSNDLPLRRGEVQISSSILGSSVSLHGAREQCYLAQNELKHAFTGARQWYGFLFRGEPALYVLGAGMGILIGLVLMAGTTGENLGNWAYVVGLVTVVATALISAVRWLCFRKVEFIFGRGERDEAWRKGARKFVFGTLAVGGVIALFNRWIAAQLGF